MQDTFSPEEIWCESQRQRVTAHLADQRLRHGRVGEWPAWHVYPHVAVWAIESVVQPVWVGWWAISGDLPTDYTTCGPERTPRAAVREFASSWNRAAAAISAGRPTDQFSVNYEGDKKELASLLASRAATLLNWAEDDSFWSD